MQENDRTYSSFDFLGAGNIKVISVPSQSTVTYTFHTVNEYTPVPEKNAKLKKAKAQYQKLNYWRNKRRDE